MAQVGNSENRFSGEYMVQDSDHLSEIGQTTGKARRGNSGQAEQAHNVSRQQGGESASASQPRNGAKAGGRNSGQR